MPGYGDQKVLGDLASTLLRSANRAGMVLRVEECGGGEPGSMGSF